MTDRELLKLALDALERAANYIDHLSGVSAGYRIDINKIREALAQPEPEPVGVVGLEHDVWSGVVGGYGNSEGNRIAQAALAKVRKP